MKNFFTGRTSFLRMHFNETHVSSGTGFFIRTPGGLALVTARHNLTGRHWETGECLSKTGAVPNKVSLYVPIAERKSPGRFGFKELVIPLTDDAPSPNAIWLEGGPNDFSWDVAVIPVPDGWEIEFVERWKAQYDVQGDFAVATMCDHAPWEALVAQEHHVGSTLFALGFPFAKDGGVRNQPIWRFGAVATEPATDWDNLPVFLADLSGRNGMSGSPVLIGMEPTVLSLAGIYTGRILDEKNHSELGYVWKLSAIDKILKAGRFGAEPCT